ncbi:MAG: DUF1684 domain-containing protein [Thermoplasmata archaeon]|nr:DUF1684 domain-containing protein [Thermoplasmata archaeon]
MSETTDWTRDLVEERRQKDDFMARHRESPFISSRVPFHDLRYFPPDPAFRIRARLERLATPAEAFLRTNRDGSAVMRYLGDLVFKVGKSSTRLRLFHAGEGVGTSVFAPFRDTTSGEESYGPGRYLTLELNESDEYELDFNRAFNPYCAYTDDFECAFPPAENDLAVPIRAGEKVWAADQNPRTPSTVMIETVEKFRAASGGAKSPPKPARSPAPKTRPKGNSRPASSRKVPATAQPKVRGKAPRSR